MIMVLPMNTAVENANPLKIIFAGTPLFAARHLQALIEARFNIVAVLTQPDKPAGRGRQLTPSPVKILADQQAIPVFQPISLKKQNNIQALLQEKNVDIVIDVAYGLIIPEGLLNIPRYGFMNVHPSLLPRFRGPAPIQHAILSGDTETGVSIMQLDAGIDTGPLYLQKRCKIEPTDTTEILSQRLALLGSSALIEALRSIGLKQPYPQSPEGVSYAHKIEKDTAKIDWTKSAVLLDREIRAFIPWPVSYTQIGGEILRVYQARPLSEKCLANAGEIVRITQETIVVATGDGLLEIRAVQFPGGKVLPVSAVLNGRKTFFEMNRKFN